MDANQAENLLLFGLLKPFVLVLQKQIKIRKLAQ